MRSYTQFEFAHLVIYLQPFALTEIKHKYVWLQHVQYSSIVTP